MGTLSYFHISSLYSNTWFHFRRGLVHQAQDYVISPPTHDIHLEASLSSEPGMLVADGFVNIIFNDDEHFGTILPESFTLATPYFLTLTDAHIPICTGFEFIRWIHPDSDQGISPGGTVLITGSGTINLYALWAFNERELALIAPTQNIHLKASQSSEPSMLAANGFVKVIFNDDEHFRTIIPKSFTIATPYFLTLTHVSR